MRTRLALQAMVMLAGGAAAGAAQTAPEAARAFPAHGIYVEAAGLPASEEGPYTLNVEQRLLPHAYLRVGAFYGQIDSENTLMVPVLLNIVVPQAAHNLEVGGGIRWDLMGPPSKQVRLGTTVGYRYQEPTGLSMIRAGLSFDLHKLSGDGSDAWTLGPWPYVSIGFGF